MKAVTLQRRFARLTAVAMAIQIIGGCASPELADREAAEYQRIDRQLRSIDEYEAFKRACRNSGGIVYMTGNGGRLRPSRADISTLTCAAAPYHIAR